MTSTTIEATTVDTRTQRFAGMAALTGPLLMIAGAIAWVASGTDMDAALEAGTMADYLVEASEQSTALTLNLSLWIVGVIALGFGGVALAQLGSQGSPSTSIARFA